MESAARDLEAARAVMQKKQDAYNLAAATYQQHHSNLETQLTSTEGKLRFGASAMIDTFITECWRRREEIRNNDFHIGHTRGEYNPETGRKRLVTLTTADAVRARLVALRQAALEAEALKLENLTDEEVRARLAALDVTTPQHRARVEHGEYDFAAS
jgi:hypothetical protein